MAADVSDNVANIAMTVMGLVILFFSFVMLSAHLSWSSRWVDKLILDGCCHGVHVLAISIYLI
jgi:hypothetical protein